MSDCTELSMLIEADAEELVDLDKSWPHTQQIDEYLFGPCTIEGALAFIRQGMAMNENDAGILFGIRVNGSLAGILQLERKKYGRTVGMDYALAPSYRGQGIVTESCAATLRFIFEELDMHRVEMWIDTVNQKSCAIPERLGFSLEGIHRHLALYGNDWYGDIVVYAQLKDEWLAKGKF
ncbi:MAG: GNAT family protein [bacterium]